MEQRLPQFPLFLPEHIALLRFKQSTAPKKLETGVYANRFRKDFNVDEKQKG
jgi:hypothetical protein